MEEVDRQRREEFKKYEMEKEYQYNQSLQNMDDEHKKQAQLKHEEDKKKHADHGKIHHPVSKDQLKEVCLYCYVI